MHLRPYPANLKANLSAQERSEPRLLPSDSITHQAMRFHLKRVFFINNFVILGAVPIGKKSVASAHFPGRGSGVGGGVSAMLAGTSAKQMLNFSQACVWTWAVSPGHRSV